jgi:Fe-S cluster assembly iron-binding protein IscA
MITSEKAGEKLKNELIARISRAGLGFRVYQEPDGDDRARLALKLDKKNSDDETIESNGVSLFLSPGYSSRLKDLELDYVDGPSGGFVLKDQCRVKQ